MTPFFAILVFTATVGAPLAGGELKSLHGYCL